MAQVTLRPKNANQPVRVLVKLPDGTEQEVTVTRHNPLTIAESQITQSIRQQLKNRVLLSINA